MKDIERAIQKEQEYISAVNNMRDGDTRPELLDYIGECGYTSAEEFHTDKEEYTLSKIVFRDWELTSDEITYHLGDICEELANNEESTIFYNIDMNQLSCFVPANFNKEDIAAELGLQPIYGRYYAEEGHGIIITGDQDLKFAMCVENQAWKWVDRVRDTVLEILSRYYSDIEYTGNDILVNGKKVAGFAARDINGMSVGMFNLCFHNYIECIDALCSYDEKKTPGYVDDPNLSARSVLNEIKSILNLR